MSVPFNLRLIKDLLQEAGQATKTKTEVLIHNVIHSQCTFNVLCLTIHKLFHFLAKHVILTSGS